MYRAEKSQFHEEHKSRTLSNERIARHETTSSESICKLQVTRSLQKVPVMNNHSVTKACCHHQPKPRVGRSHICSEIALMNPTSRMAPSSTKSLDKGGLIHSMCTRKTICQYMSTSYWITVCQSFQSRLVSYVSWPPSIKHTADQGDLLAINLTWPGVSPFGRSTDSNPVRNAWLGCAMDAPLAFYSFVFAAGLHHAYLRGWKGIPSSAFTLLLSYKTQAIKLINEALQRVDDEIPDHLLVSILILAAHGPRSRSLDDAEPVHPPSPLANAQHLQFYAALDFDRVHMDALRVLISRRGGLSEIKLYSLAETIAL